MWQFQVLLCSQAVIGVVILVLIYKISKIENKIDDITKEVKDYLSFIIKEEEEIEEVPQKSGKNSPKIQKEETQNSIIFEVLGEYFP